MGRTTPSDRVVEQSVPVKARPSLARAAGRNQGLNADRQRSGHVGCERRANDLGIRAPSVIVRLVHPYHSALTVYKQRGRDRQSRTAGHSKIVEVLVAVAELVDNFELGIGKHGGF